MGKIISEEAIKRRNNWIDKIHRIDGHFASNSQEIEKELGDDLKQNGISFLLDHLRLCGNIPESYKHDSSQEKQYSKYTDALLCFAYKAMGLKSIVLTERADVADVETYAKEFSFVADAKAFRLSRTAKNQKDFKVQAMDRWKHGKPYAMVVCPIYQLPSRNSQIYLQAISRDVCVFSYSHLTLLVRYAEVAGNGEAEDLLHNIFKIVPTMHPSKSSNDYWMSINRTILNHSDLIQKLWREEKIAASESIAAAKYEGLRFLAQERERIMKMSHDDAIKSLLKKSKIENKLSIINSIKDNGLFEVR